MRVYYLGLEAFVAIADFGSFRRAAEALNLSQTALSHRLRKVEDDIGTALLRRTSREVSLTAAGQDLLPQARRLLRELHDSYDTVRVQAQQAMKKLSFACLPSIANSLLPEALRIFNENRPGVSIHLQDMPVHMINDRVLSGEAEFGITVAAAHLSELEMRELVEEDYMLLVPANHEYAARDHIDRPDLVGMPMARISTQSKNRQLVDVALGDYRDDIIWQFEVRNGTAAMNIVAAGLAFTILPRSATAMAPPNLVALPFGDVRLSRTLGVVSRRGVPLSAPATDLLARIEQCIASHVQGKSLKVAPASQGLPG